MTNREKQARFRERQKQKIEHLTWALTRVVENTELPADRRDDIGWLRSAVVLAHSFAKAGLAPPLDPVEPATS